MIIWHNYTMVIILTIKMWCDYKVVIILTLVIWHNLVMVIILTLLTWYKFNDGSYDNFENMVLMTHGNSCNLGQLEKLTTLTLVICERLSSKWLQ